jgi:RNA 3'-terminal phosphate cyclase (ATP)
MDRNRIMITIDGSEGEGGGQVLRNACALSLITGQPFRIFNIRGKRAKPGLMRQHYTAIDAACRISGSQCDGLSIGSTEITFRPEQAIAGDYHFAVGTAGSTALVLQTILMPLIFADGPSRLVIEGGTHTMAAPPFEFLERCFLPIINRMGPKVTARLIRHGFFPRGGGRVEVEIDPAPLRRIECMDRGALVTRTATAFIAGLPGEIAVREIAEAKKRLPDWPEDAFAIRELPEDQGPGNILLVEAMYEHTTEITSGFGRVGLSSEALAKETAQRMAGFMATNAFAGPYLADQLLLPFALAGGGAFTTVKPSLHARTAADIIARFTGRETQFVQTADALWTATIE